MKLTSLDAFQFGFNASWISIFISCIFRILPGMPSVCTKGNPFPGLEAHVFASRVLSREFPHVAPSALEGEASGLDQQFGSNNDSLLGAWDWNTEVEVFFKHWSYRMQRLYIVNQCKFVIHLSLLEGVDSMTPWDLGPGWTWLIAWFSTATVKMRPSGSWLELFLLPRFVLMRRSAHFVLQALWSESKLFGTQFCGLHETSKRMMLSHLTTWEMFIEVALQNVNKKQEAVASLQAWDGYSAVLKQSSGS